MINYKSVYFIQCHESSTRLKNLIRYIYDRDSLFIIHIDRKSNYELKSTASNLCKSFPNAIEIPSIFVSWGGFSQVTILINALSCALEIAKEWSHFILLSEHHLPVRSGKEIRSFLAEGISYVSSTKFDFIPPQGQIDIAHRFSAVSRELTAWGMFPISAANDEEFIDIFVYQGSNWVILAREHCKIIVSSQDNKREIFARLASSIQSDEIFVQTMMNLSGEIRNVINRDFTYVAWPHLSGTSNLTFIEENFFDAIEKEYLFIRKTPDVIPDRVKDYLSNFAYCNEEDFNNLLSVNHTNISDNSEAELAKIIIDYINSKIDSKEISVENINDNPVHFTPKFYLKFRMKNINNKIFVALISENIEDFKILIRWQNFDDGRLEPCQIAEFQTHVIKARISDIIFNREVCVSSDPESGFFKLSGLRSLDELISRINLYTKAACVFDKVLKEELR